MSTLDLFAAQEARDAGMELAYGNRTELVAQLRARLEYIAGRRADRTASADDVSELLEQMGLDNSDLGNAAGTVFKHEWWEFSGEWRPSSRKSNHARHIRVWRLK